MFVQFTKGRYIEVPLVSTYYYVYKYMCMLQINNFKHKNKQTNQ